MTDKLAEAIEFLEGKMHWMQASDFDGEQGVKDVIEAARKYHALPVVDVETLKRPEIGGNLEYELMDRAHNDFLEMLKASYPNGLKWKV